jgi:hypothetical protein
MKRIVFGEIKKMSFTNEKNSFWCNKKNDFMGFEGMVL